MSAPDTAYSIAAAAAAVGFLFVLWSLVAIELSGYAVGHAAAAVGLCRLETVVDL